MRRPLPLPSIALALTVLLALAACSPTQPRPTARPTQAESPLPGPRPTATLAVPSPQPTATPAAPTPAPPPVQGEWQRITTADGLCTDWPLLIGYWYIGTGTTTFCGGFRAGPGEEITWDTAVVPIGTRVTAAVKFPPGGQLGVATDAGVCHYEPGQLPGEEGSWRCETPAGGFPYEDVRGMTNLAERPVYMLADAVAVEDGQTYRIPEIVGDEDARPTWIAVSGEYDPDPEIWAGTNGYGVIVIQLGTGEARRYTTADGLPSDVVRDVQSTMQGKMGPGYPIWIATDGGVGRWDGQQWTAYTTADGLPSNDVRGIAPTQDGTVWAATAGGVAYYGGFGSAESHGTSWHALTAEDGVPEGDVKGVIAWGDEAWFSTRGSGLLVFLIESSGP